MKKCLLFIFMISLFLPVGISSVYADGVTLPEYINVGLKYGADAVKSAKISVGGVLITELYGVSLLSDENVSELTVAYENGAVSVYEGNNLRLSYAGDIIISPHSDTISLDGVSYRGSLKFVIADSALAVINVVSMDDYLCGVVPREIGGSSPLEALKAQAVCARSYTARFLGKHSEDGFDICTNVHCQVYGGVSAETALANQAVYDTSGIIALYNDKIAELYYFSSDGGATEDVENVWGSTLHPYLKGVDDPYETESATHHTWSVTFTKNEINEIFAPYGLGDITDISIAGFSDKGAVTALTVVGTNGSKTFEKEKCRTVFNGKIYSQAYTITKNYANGNTPAALSSTQTVQLPSTIYVIGKDGVSQKRLEDVSVITSSGTYKLQTGGDAASYTINGRGWGHLIGMSQWGAIAMASNGYAYEDILNHYYTGITLKGFK